jgi:hypothetical protein
MLKKLGLSIRRTHAKRRSTVAGDDPAAFATHLTLPLRQFAAGEGFNANEISW